MKDIEKIVGMDPGELEAEALKAAGEEDCTGKAGAEGLIDALGRAEALMMEETETVRRRWLAPIAVAAGLALVAGIGLRWQQGAPKDSFTDPEQAYAQVEMAFSKIGDGLKKGSEAMEKSAEIIQKPIEIINN